MSLDPGVADGADGVDRVHGALAVDEQVCTTSLPWRTAAGDVEGEPRLSGHANLLVIGCGPRGGLETQKPAGAGPPRPCPLRPHLVIRTLSDPDPPGYGIGLGRRRGRRLLLMLCSAIMQ